MEIIDSRIAELSFIGEPELPPLYVPDNPEPSMIWRIYSKLRNNSNGSTEVDSKVGVSDTIVPGSGV